MYHQAQAGQAFGHTSQRQSDLSSISSMSGAWITVNRQAVQEAFDRNGNPLWMIRQLLSLLWIVVGWIKTKVYNLHTKHRNKHFIIVSIFGQDIFKTNSTFDYDAFRHPSLIDHEHKNGGWLGIDSWTDTACAGKHVYVKEFVVGKLITASGFTPELGALTNLPVANVLYAYDSKDGQTIILESNKAIYLGKKMHDSLLNPIQAEEEGIRIVVRPQCYYPNDWTT